MPPGRRSLQGVGAGCITTQILLLDGTPATGYRSFLNFLAYMSAADIQAVDDTLHEAARRVAASAMAAECAHLRQARVPLLTAMHHPLGVVQHRGARTWLQRALQPLAPARQASLRLKELLAEHNASMVVSGHLHDAFGPRMHGFHRLRHAASQRSVPRLLEAEAADWKFRRRFRLITMQHDAVSFTDLRFHVRRGSADASMGGTARGEAAARRAMHGTVNVPESAWVQAEDPEAVAHPFIVHIVDPPDARYFPSRSDAAGWQLQLISAYVVPTHSLAALAGMANTTEQTAANADAQAAEANAVSVTAAVRCRRSGHGSGWLQQLELQHQGAPAQSSCGNTAGPLFVSADASAALQHAAAQCQADQGSLTVQIAAHSSLHGTALSDLRPILAQVAAAAQPLPMGATLVETTALKTDWPVAAAVAYWGLLGATVAGMLLMQAIALTPYLRRQYNATHQHVHLRAVGMQPDSAPFDRPLSCRHEPSLLKKAALALAKCAHALLALAGHPLRTLVQATLHARLWRCCVGYLAYLAAAPHAIVEPLAAARAVHILQCSRCQWPWLLPSTSLSLHAQTVARHDGAAILASVTMPACFIVLRWLAHMLLHQHSLMARLVTWRMLLQLGASLQRRMTACCLQPGRAAGGIGCLQCWRSASGTVASSPLPLPTCYW